MSSPELPSINVENPQLQEILSIFGDVLVVSHSGNPVPLSVAVEQCPPFIDALLRAESPEQLQQIVDALKPL